MTNQYKWICFDVDGTLIDDTIYIWVTLHDAFGVSRELRKKHYEDFMNKKITYPEWFELDILEWKKRNIHKKDLVSQISRLSVIPGVHETISILKQKGYKIAVISGSLDLVLQTKLPEVKFDEVFINRLKFGENEKLTGGIPTPYDLEHKASGLIHIAEKYGISPEECVFIGDNENDVHIASIAGLSIGFNLKSEKLSEIVNVVVKKKDMREILQYL